MISQADLLKRVKRFLFENDMQPSVFGRTVLNDPSFVFELENGRNVRLGTADRVMRYISNYGKMKKGGL